MSPHSYRLVLAPVLAVVVAALAACGAGDSVREHPSVSKADADGCLELEGVYPPDTILVTGTRQVSVPYTAWSCVGYDGHGGSELPVVEVGTEGMVTVNVDIRDGAEFDIRAQAGNKQIPLDVLRFGEDAVLTVGPLPDTAQEVFIRMCTQDGRCANYEARVDHS